ncbi:flagellin [Dactylosporangium sucinum]|uniref:Flagellin n=1 Tax=Dactylosporangium sucinum TaxID=1424081 RepID=A0A917U5T2_9ACTN|nr:flagellin [Dactylosporangium sucinum]GGM60894.1 flagellin [Dactylosporangium sucinum]
MGLRINNNIAAQNAYRNLSVTDSQMSKSLEKLSSGYRINRAADDAAGLSISEGLRSQIGGLKVAVRNAQDGISVVQTAEGALTETHSILQRMRDLSVQASSTGSQDSDARAAAQTEFTQLTSELNRIATTTQFGGQKLLDVSGGAYTGTFQVGANTASADQIAVKLDSSAFGSPASVSGFDASGLGLASLDLTTSGTAAIDAIDSAIKGVSTARATLGAYQNRFEHTINNLNVAIENLSASESRIRDTDMAQEMVSFTRSQILTQAGTSMLAQANQAPQNVLSLLR